MRNHTRLFAVAAGMMVVVSALGACSKSRVEMLRDRSAVVERKLEVERNSVLAGGQLMNTARGGREAAISHLQTLRGALSVVNISITSVPLFLQDPAQREVGYSVLDEAIGTIDWNIPLYQSSASGAQRPFPALFSPQQGLNYLAIQDGARPTGIAK